MVGRPTKYDKKYCEQLIAHMEEGYSFESFAGKIGVNRDTIYEWVNVHQDFSDAKKMAFEVSRLFWEKKAIDNLICGKEGYLNTTLWIFNMKNRFPDEWKDKQESVVTQKVINVNPPSEE